MTVDASHETVSCVEMEEKHTFMFSFYALIDADCISPSPLLSRHVLHHLLYFDWFW